MPKPTTISIAKDIDRRSGPVWVHAEKSPLNCRRPDGAAGARGSIHMVATSSANSAMCTQ